MKRKTKEIKIGNLKIGNNNPILIQSMTSALTKDIDKVVNQIHELEEIGCEIIRVAVPDMESAEALKEIKENIKIPLVADIHFDYKLAIESAKYVDKLRINPGNIGSDEKIKAVVDAAKEYKLPIRIGVNLGSLEKDIEAKYGLTAKAMVESALKNIALFEKQNFYDIVVSLKASDVLRTVEANRLFSNVKDYPLHVGVSESGHGSSGTIKSSVGIGILLSEGIGDTIRVSLSDNPIEEVKVAKHLLQSLKLRRFGVEITSCPTCARANFDVAKIAKEIEDKTSKIKKELHVAIMGCAVNGPGEAKEADIGVVGGKGNNLFYKNGEIVDKIEEKDIVKKIIDNIKE